MLIYYKVLIVDDEKWMRDSIAKAIDWKLHGFEIAGYAKNGVLAFEKIKKLKPDIVLADIRMPGLDGISLLKKLREEKFETLFIFFSGYDSFDYAKDAINFGASGYLLKPVDENELLKLLLKEKENLQLKQQKDSREKQLSGLMENESERKKSEYIIQVLKGKIKGKVIVDIELKKENQLNVADKKPEKKNQLNKYDKKLKQETISKVAPKEEKIETTKFDFDDYDIKFISDLFLVISLQIENNNSLADYINSQQEQEQFYAFKNIISDAFNKSGILNFTVNLNDTLFVLTNINYSNQDMITERINLMSKSIMNELLIASPESNIFIGIGSLVSGLDNVSKSYEESKRALENKIFSDKCGIYSAREEDKNACINIIMDSDFENEIRLAFDKYDYNIAEKIVDRIKNLLINQKIGIDDIKRFNYCLVDLIYHIMRESGSVPNPDYYNPHKMYDEISSYKKIEVLYDEYQSLIKKSIEIISESRKGYTEKLAHNIKMHIINNYTEGISLDSIAEEFSFHPNYISKIIKQEFGVNFVDFLTKYRIERAKELLRGSMTHNVSEVGKIVGYTNPKYFSKVFKKIVGVTPVEYIGKSKPGNIV